MRVNNSSTSRSYNRTSTRICSSVDKESQSNFSSVTRELLDVEIGFNLIDSCVRHSESIRCEANVSEHFSCQRGTCARKELKLRRGAQRCICYSSCDKRSGVSCNGHSPIRVDSREVIKTHLLPRTATRAIRDV